jgi:hypothetical protein
MAETTAKVPVKIQKGMESSTTPHPFESLRREINRLFDFPWGGWPFPSGRTMFDLEPFSRTEGFDADGRYRREE